MREVFGFEKKDKYTPSSAKRFEIADDEFSRNRIRLLRDIHHELEKELGISISFSIFGSLSKGKKLTPETAPRADMDILVYLDSAELPKEEESRQPIKKAVKQNILDRLEAAKDKLGYKEIPIEGISVNVIDSETIDEILRSHGMAEWGSTLFSDKTTEYKILLSTFFGLSIGSPVKKYRNEFLAKLAKDPQRGEGVWDDVKNFVEKAERKGKIPRQIKHQFPRTLQDALKYYGVKIEKNEEQEKIA